MRTCFTNDSQLRFFESVCMEHTDGEFRPEHGRWGTDRVINVSTVPHRSPFRYPGGKTWLVPHVRKWLRSLPKLPTEFAEPFAGGATVGLSVLFEGLAAQLTLVERDAEVAAVWITILNGHAKQLAAQITSFDLTPQAVKALLGTPPETLLDRAFATIVRNRVQRGGIMARGASLMNKGENGRGIKSRWYPTTLRKRIEAIGELRDRVTFIHGNGMAFLRYSAHRRDLAFLIDPPYTVAGRRLYTHSDVDHEKLFKLASLIKGDFLMTYDNTKEIEHLAKQYGFDTQEVAMKNTHHEVMTELLVGKDLGWARVPDSSICPESSPRTSPALSGGLQ